MTDDSDFKRLVRERMARTGESYTTARAHLLAKAAPTGDGADDAAQATTGSGPEASYAMGDGTALTASKERLQTNLESALGDATLEFLENELHVELGGFEAHVPYASITALKAVPDKTPGSSLGAHGSRGRWLVNAEYTGLVQIDIDPPIRAELRVGDVVRRATTDEGARELPRLLRPLLLRTWRPKVRELTISVRDRDTFTDELRSRIGHSVG